MTEEEMLHHSVVVRARLAEPRRAPARQCRTCGACSGKRAQCGACTWAQNVRERPRIDAEIRAKRRRRKAA